MTTNTNEVMRLTQNIKTMLNELQELVEDHFQLSPECITDEQVEALLYTQKAMMYTLLRAKKVSLNTKS